jgi:hypothetical protein
MQRLGEISRTRRNARHFATLNGAPRPTKASRRPRERTKIMEVVEAIALCHFSDTRIGGVSRKQRLRLPALLADQLESVGLIEIVNPSPTVVISPRQTAPLAVGAGALSQSSPAAPVLPREIAEGSLKPIHRQSRSMTPIGSPPAQPRSTRATVGGGKSTTKRSVSADLQVSSGPKTSGQQSDSA